MTETNLFPLWVKCEGTSLLTFTAAILDHIAWLEKEKGAQTGFFDEGSNMDGEVIERMKEVSKRASDGLIFKAFTRGTHERPT